MFECEWDLGLDSACLGTPWSPSLFNLIFFFHSLSFPGGVTHTHDFWGNEFFILSTVDTGPPPTPCQEQPSHDHCRCPRT